MLSKWNESQIKAWTPVYAQYQTVFLLIFLLSLLLGFAVLFWKLEWIQIPFLILLNALAYLPAIGWEIKTGYLTNPIFLPTGLLGYKVKAISRANSPFFFWVGIGGETFLILAVFAVSLVSIVG